MTVKGYNGWANWETWNVNLWLDNEEPLYREKVRFLRFWRADITADIVEEFCRSQFPDGTPDMQSDERETVAEQWAKVDWSELATAWESEAKEYE